MLKQRLRDTYITGKGSVLMRGKVYIEGEEGAEKKGKKSTKRGSTTTQSIIISELPYQICKVRSFCIRSTACSSSRCVLPL